MLSFCQFGVGFDVVNIAINLVQGFNFPDRATLTRVYSKITT